MRMDKNEELYNRWNKEKIHINSFGKVKFAEPWEIWLAKIGVNIWGELSKDDKFIRPVLIIKNNLGRDLVAIIPMSTKFHERYKRFYVSFDNWKRFGMNKKSYFVLNQFKVISTKRLMRKINDIVLHWELIPTLDQDFIDDLVAKVIR